MEPAHPKLAHTAQTLLGAPNIRLTAGRQQPHLCTDGVVHQVHSALQDVPPLRSHELRQRPRKEAGGREPEAPVPASTILLRTCRLQCDYSNRTISSASLQQNSPCKKQCHFFDLGGVT